MIAEDEDALTCDMAETYHVLDMWALPVDKLAVLACGLRANSRIRMKMGGVRNHVPADLLLPKIADSLEMINYVLRGEKKKPSLVTDFVYRDPPKREAKGFASGADFEAARRRILEKNNA